LKKYFPNMITEEGESKIPFEASQADLVELRKAVNWVPEEDLETAIPDIISFEKSRDGEQKSSSPPNVLITSISKKVPLIKAVRSGVQKVSDKPKIFGADVDDTCIGQYFVDVFWHMPKLNELNIEDLVKYCKLNNIGAIIPTRDGELEFFARYKPTLAEQGIFVMISDYSIVSACLDKLEFAKLKGIEDFAIPVSTDIKTLKSKKFVVKERFGSGSISIGLSLDPKAAQLHAETLEKPIYQPFQTGYEITIDAYLTRNSKVKGIIMRKRIKVVNGESQVTASFKNEFIQKKFFDFLSQSNFCGHITMQAIIDEADNVHLIECNPRVGGASMLSIYAGLDSFYWFYSEILGENLSTYPFLPASKPVMLVRYPNDIYL